MVQQLGRDVGNKKSKYQWSISNISHLIVFLDIAVSKLLMVIISLFWPLIEVFYRGAPQQLKDGIASCVETAVAALYLLKRYSLDISHFRFNANSITDSIRYGLVGGFVLSVLNFPYGLVFSKNYDIPPSLYLNHDAGLSILWFYVVVKVVFIPVVEEILFRGGVYRVLKAIHGPLLASVVTCILFGVSHGNLGGGYSIIWYAIYSYILILVYDRSNALLGPAIAHVMWNGTWYLGIYMLK